MFNNVIFYCHFGNGDIFESREFIKEIMEIIPARNYYYSHNKNPRILMDIPNLEFMEISPIMNPRTQVLQNGDTLFINTWIGITGEYLLPGIGCTVERLYDMYNHILDGLHFRRLSKSPIGYVPEINYLYYDLDPCNEFLQKHPEEKIFIDNGMVMSLQAENFPFSELIYDIARAHPELCFIVTNGLPKVENVFTTDYITKMNYGFDLPEISYLSTFCSTLIGRNSGPHVFTQVKKNVMDESKKLLSFTYRPTGSSFVINTPVNIRRYWSDAIESDKVKEIIELVIND